LRVRKSLCVCVTGPPTPSLGAAAANLRVTLCYPQRECAFLGREEGLAKRLATLAPLGRLALLDVVDLEDLRLAGKLDPGLGQHRHEALTERLELLPRIPDLADP
jgi:hypothetical protein